MLAVSDIVPVLTSVTVTVFAAMMPHGVEHSSEFCANVKVAALPPAGAPTLRARAYPAAASAPVSFDFIIASLVVDDHMILNIRSSACVAPNGQSIFFKQAAFNATIP